MLSRVLVFVFSLAVIAQAGFKVSVPMELGETLPEYLEFTAPYKDGVNFTISAKQEKRADGFKLLVQDEGAVQEVTAPPVRAYRGFAKEDSTQRVVVTAKGTELEVYYFDKPPVRTFTIDTYREVECGYEFDYAYFELAGDDLDSVMMRIDRDMAKASEVFYNELKIILSHDFFVVRANKSTCPYQNHIPYTKRVLDRIKWQVGIWDKDPLIDDSQVDLVHIITGVSPGSGMAARGGVCEPGHVVTGGIYVDGKYAGSGPNSDGTDAEFYRVLRHEIGHQLGASDHYGDNPDGETIMWGNGGDYFSETIIVTELIPSLDTLPCLSEKVVSIIEHKPQFDPASISIVKSSVKGNLLTLKMNGNHFSAAIYTLQGKYIKKYSQRALMGNQAVLNLSGNGSALANGQYLVRINLDGKQVVQKFVIAN